MDLPDSQWLTAARVEPQAAAIWPRVTPARTRRLMALVGFTVTDGNPSRHGSQPRVTHLNGNLALPSLGPPSVPTSQRMRKTFDIVKAEEMRARAGNPSYAKIAAALGLKTRQSVGHWFRGRGEPDVQQMKGMAKVLGCHWLELVTDDTVIVYREDERDRLQMIRQMSEQDLEELDAYLAVKAASRRRK